MTTRIGLAAYVFGGAEMMPVTRHAGFDLPMSGDVRLSANYLSRK